MITPAAPGLCLTLQCIELDFRKPTAQQIAARMKDVCQNEGLAVNEATLRTLIEGGQGDLRLVLGQLQVSTVQQVAALALMVFV